MDQELEQSLESYEKQPEKYIFFAEKMKTKYDRDASLAFRRME